MALEDFATESSSNESSSSGNTSSLSSKDKVSDVDRSIPHFCAILDETTSEVKVFTGEQAFTSSCIHKHERHLGCVETEEEYNNLDDTCRELYGIGLEELFYSDPVKASDFLTRLSLDSHVDSDIQCAVCEEFIDVKQDKYTKLDGYHMHSSHTAEEVVEEIEEVL